MKEMQVKKIKDAEFQLYGQVVSNSQRSPDCKTEEFTFTGEVCLFTMEGEITTGILESFQREVAVTCMERHKDTQELLVNVVGDGILCVGKADNTTSEVKNMMAFLVKQGDAVLLHKGTWHWVPYPVECPYCKTLVIFKRGTGEHDFELAEFKEAVTIQRSGDM